MRPATRTGCGSAALFVGIAVQVVGQVSVEVGPEERRGGCGTVLRPENVPLARELHAAALNSPPPGQRGGEPWIAPVTVHIVRQSNGSGGLPLANWARCLADANLTYANAGIRFVQPLPIRYIDDDDFYTNIYTQEELDALRSTDVICGTINVYFTPALNLDEYYTCGYSSFTFDPVQGIVISNNCVGIEGNWNTEFRHQMGHYFNLYDTHEHRFGYECVARTNCLDAGDLLCDTPADPNLGLHTLGEVCRYIGEDTDFCAGAPYQPDERNMMSHASPSSCLDHFSDGQSALLRYHLANLRLYDWAPSACPCAMLVWVDRGSIPPFSGTQADPYFELADGLGEVCPGGTIFLRPSSYPEAPLTISQPVTLGAFGGLARIE